MKKLSSILVVCLTAALILSLSSCAGSHKTVADETPVSESEISSETNTGTEEAEQTTSDTDVSTTDQTSTAPTTTTAASAPKTTAAPSKPAQSNANNVAKAVGVQHNIGSSPANSSKTGGTAPVTNVKTIDSKSSSTAQQKLYDAYQKAVTKTNSLNACDYDMSMQIQANENGKSYSETMSGNLKMVKSGSSFQLLSSENIQDGSQSANILFYYADGTLYLSNGSEKIKCSMDLSTMESTTQTSVPSSSKELLEKDFEYSESSSSDGSTVITLNITPESLKKLYGNSFASTSDGANYFNASMQFVISKDGYLTSSLMKCNAKLTTTVNGKQETIDMYISYKMTLNNPGQPVTITPPAHLGTYQEITSSSLS